ncbi:aconitate hydratase AcnA [Novosphingobium sp.]|uniref:aconitate hydratase AcnA n=1 Tax=Novosphingobium sp. TaxID=1874826 RepID=UPI0035B3B72A
MDATRTPLARLGSRRHKALKRLPRSLVILLENILAHEPEPDALIARFEAWLEHGHADAELPFRPGRILMQDTAGVAALADLAALRDFAADQGHHPEAVDAAIPIDLVIDHSLRVDFSGTADAATRNLALEYDRNDERYRFFKWAEHAFARLRIVPPGEGICHQVNLERLTRGTIAAPEGSGTVMAETVIGTDSHTTMVNALGVLGWGVGGIEAELAALGSAVPIMLPRVAEVRITGRRRPGVTATDIALAMTAALRKAGLVDVIAEFTGPGLDELTLPDRAAIANMCPEYGATAGLFPVDETTLDYLAAMGRSAEDIAAYRGYAKATGLWRGDTEPRVYSRSLEFALDGVEAVMAGPARPQQLHPLSAVPESLRAAFPAMARPAPGEPGDGAIAIAAITSCTNTANPELMIAAGLLARKAVQLGLQVPAWVKTSLAPGSRRIAALLQQAGLQPFLDQLGFNVVGFGCTTCVGNSGALKPELVEAGGNPAKLLVAVLSGNRNFENRIHAAVQANYLASPPLVVAAALAGNLQTNLDSEPIGFTPAGDPVTLSQLWPSEAEIAEAMAQAASSASAQGVEAADHTAAWRKLPAQAQSRFAWDPASTFIRQPQFFARPACAHDSDIAEARALLVLGDNFTTDHISPIGAIRPGSPAAIHLCTAGEAEDRLGGYGDRRANHDVMLRGTFDNARLENRLVGRPGNLAVDPQGKVTSVFDAAAEFAAKDVPVVIFAGENYGTGSARDWAAKGTALLGVRAVIARSFERIHRANLVALGVLPILVDGTCVPPVAEDRITVRGVGGLSPQDRSLTIEIHRAAHGRVDRYDARADVHTAGQLALLRSGGLFAALRQRFARPG